MTTTQKKERVFNVYFSDNPFDPLKVKCENKTKAREIGRLYNKQWQLHTMIIKIEEVFE